MCADCVSVTGVYGGGNEEVYDEVGYMVVYVTEVGRHSVPPCVLTVHTIKNVRQCEEDGETEYGIPAEEPHRRESTEKTSTS